MTTQTTQRRQRGRCTEWGKTFGYLDVGDGAPVFAHFSEIQMDGFRRLEPGAVYSFRRGHDAQGRVRALEIRAEDVE